MSWAEAGINVTVGYGVALLAQMVVFPLMGLAVTLSQNLKIGVIFLTIGLVRSYLLRRMFNWMHVRWSGVHSVEPPPS